MVSLTVLSVDQARQQSRADRWERDQCSDRPLSQQNEPGYCACYQLPGEMFAPTAPEGTDCQARDLGNDPVTSVLGCGWGVPWVVEPRSLTGRGWSRRASSSRSQRAMRAAKAAACLAWEATSVDVRWRPLLSVVIVTHLVTRSRASRWYERSLRRASPGQ
jgi:hypothetical protein